MSHPRPFAAVLITALVAFSPFAALAASAPSAAAPAPAVGYQSLSIPDPEGPPVEIGIWYPAEAAGAPTQVGPFVQSLAADAPVDGEGLALIVMSHGNGGSFTSHADTALALAQAGFVVAALTHTGDNYHDQGRAVDMANRPRQLKLLVDYMLATWPEHRQIDPMRIGAFGFSSGGFTVLTAAGGVPDLSAVIAHCAAHPTYFDCALLARSRAQGGQTPQVAPVWTHDPRLKAVVVAAPALGFTFGRAGLAGVALPVQLWRAENDHILPQPDYAEAVRAALPVAPDYHVAQGADHFDFLAPCSDVLKAQAPFICASSLGFDRAAFHQAFNDAVTAFFLAKLAR
jgi:predicted dienelactone hydrolase